MVWKPDVSVIVPVYGNRATLAAVCDGVERAFADSTPPVVAYEIILVDDCSPDQAWQEIVRLSARPAVWGIRLERNCGHQQAVLAGFSVARGTWLVSIDGDLQDPPEAIPALLSNTEGMDVVFAGRRGHYQGLGRMVTSRLYRLLLPLLLPVPADAGMFLAIRADQMSRVMGMAAGPASLIAQIGLAGLRCRSVPVLRRQRAVGRSSYTSWARLLVFWRILATIARQRLASAPVSASPETMMSQACLIRHQQRIVASSGRDQSITADVSDDSPSSLSLSRNHS